MKIRFGEFPEDHHFILITRPFVEWSFKFIGWMILTATIRYAYEKTSSTFLLGMTIFAYLLLLGFVGAFVDWFRSFRFNSALKRQPIDIAKLGRWKRMRSRAGRGLAIFLGFALTAVLIGAMNIVTEKVIDSILVHYEKMRP